MGLGSRYWLIQAMVFVLLVVIHHDGTRRPWIQPARLCLFLQEQFFPHVLGLLLALRRVTRRAQCQQAKKSFAYKSVGRLIAHCSQNTPNGTTPTEELKNPPKREVGARRTTPAWAGGTLGQKILLNFCHKVQKLLSKSPKISVENSIISCHKVHDFLSKNPSFLVLKSKQLWPRAVRRELGFLAILRHQGPYAVSLP